MDEKGRVTLYKLACVLTSVRAYMRYTHAQGPGDGVAVTLDNMKSMMSRDRGEKDLASSQCVFAQAYRQLSETDPKLLRTVWDGERVFQVRRRQLHVSDILLLQSAVSLPTNIMEYVYSLTNTVYATVPTSSAFFVSRPLISRILPRPHRPTCIGAFGGHPPQFSALRLLSALNYQLGNCFFRIDLRTVCFFVGLQFFCCCFCFV